MKSGLLISVVLTDLTFAFIINCTAFITNCVPIFLWLESPFTTGLIYIPITIILLELNAINIRLMDLSWPFCFTQC